MIEVRVIGEEDVLARLGSASGRIRERLSAAIKRLQYALVDAAQASYDASGLKSRTSALRGSIKAGKFEESGDSIRASVVAGGGDAFYARIHEYGGTIRAKNVQNLTIPVGEALTAMGVARFSARQVIADPSAYGYTSTFFKHGMLFANSGLRITPLFVLRPSVRIPARPYMRPALSGMLSQITGEISQAVAQGAKG